MEGGDGVEGLVVYSGAGLFRVATPAGELLCRARGRLRGRGAAWRDERDADRVRDALEPEPADEEDDVAGSGGTPAPPEPVARGSDPQRLHGSARRGGEDPSASTPLAGDRVRCRELGGGEGVVEQVLPRRSLLDRPPVANPDQVVAVLAWTEPPWSSAYVDRLLCAIALAGCTARLCLNKVDLLDAGALAAAQAALAGFRQAGCPVHLTSAVRGTGLDALRLGLRDQVSVLAGPSGGGKSALLRALHPGRRARSGAVSARSRRGRHTTRTVELLALPSGGWLADTPGFSRIDLRDATPADLPTLYPEFAPHQTACRFRGCLHDAEPDCAVRAAVAAGAIDGERYARYLQLLAELRQRSR